MARAGANPRAPESPPEAALRRLFPAQSESPLAIDFLASMQAARRAAGKPALAQLAEIAALTFTGNRLSPLDYYRYQLYDDSRHDWASRRRFVGDRRCHETFRRVVGPGWRAAIGDKLASAAFLEGHGFSVPVVRAVHHPLRTHTGAAHLPTDAALAAWLRSEACFPLFAKPIRGFQGRGALWLERLDAASDTLALRGGERIGVDAFAASLRRGLASLRADAAAGGPAYLFQDVVAQHPEVVARCGESVGCVRAMVGVEKDGVRPLAWIWKIPAPHQPADNISRAGNLLAALDAESGEILRLVRGCGVDLEILEDNPYTGRRLLGFRLPEFAALRDAVLRGGALLPDVRLQSWDVAVGREGPVVIEVNPAGTHSLPQLATGRGFWTEEVRAFLRRAERENPARPRGLRRLGWTGHPLGRLDGAWRLLRGLADRRAARWAAQSPAQSAAGRRASRRSDESP